VLKVREIYEYNVGLFVFKLKQGLLPLCQSYIEFDNNTNYKFRNVEEVKHVYCRTSLRKKFVKFSACDVWKKLVLDIRNSPCVPKFKKSLLLYLINKNTEL